MIKTGDRHQQSSFVRGLAVSFLFCSSSFVCAVPLSGTPVMEEIKVEMVFRRYLKASEKSADSVYQERDANKSGSKKAGVFNRKLASLPVLARENYHLINLFARNYPTTLKILGSDKAYNGFRYLLESEFEALELLHAHAPKTYARFLSGYLNHHRKNPDIDDIPDLELAGLPAINLGASLADDAAKFLGYQGDTISLGRYQSDDLAGSHVKIEECLQTGDYDHDGTVMLVPADKLIIRSYRSPGISRDWQEVKSDDYYIADLDYLYMLPGSKLSLTICTRSNSSPGAKGVYYAFDNYQDYITFTEYPDEKFNYVKRYDLKDGCQSFDFEPAKSSYYFLTGFLPKGASYKYDVQSVVLYYKASDYTQYKQCTARTDHACEFDLPKTGTYEVIVGVESDTSKILPPTTHYCLDQSEAGQLVTIKDLLK